MRRPRCRICPLLLPILLLALAGCGRQAGTLDFSFFAMDTVVTARVAFTDSADAGDRARIRKLAEDCVAEAEAALTAHADSPVSRFNAGAADELALDGIVGACVETSLAVMDATESAFDCTLGPLAALWNVTGGGPKPSDEAIRETLTHTGRGCFDFSPDRVTRLDPKAALDFGGVGKGAAADLLAERLRDDPAMDWAVLSLGGNVALVGEKPDGPFRVGMRDPQNPADNLGVLLLDGGFVSVSGSYERYFEENGVRYHHIFDGRSGYPAESGLLSAAVIAASGTLADALSTACFVMGSDEALALRDTGIFSFEAVFVHEDGSVTLTPGLRDRFEARRDVRVLPIQP